MPTTKPRFMVTMNVHDHEVIARFAELQGKTRGRVVAEILETIIPPLRTSVALFEAAAEAPSQVRENLKQSLSVMERELVGVAGASLAQVDWLLKEAVEASREGKKEGAARSRGDLLTPVPVTRGSQVKRHKSAGGRKAKPTKGSE